MKRIRYLSVGLTACALAASCAAQPPSSDPDLWKQFVSTPPYLVDRDRCRGEADAKVGAINADDLRLSREFYISPEKAREVRKSTLTDRCMFTTGKHPTLGPMKADPYDVQRLRDQALWQAQGLPVPETSTTTCIYSPVINMQNCVTSP